MDERLRLRQRRRRVACLGAVRVIVGRCTASAIASASRIVLLAFGIRHTYLAGIEPRIVPYALSLRPR